ncbi:hypothetical protein KST83_10680 [Fusobacterium nucleatum]|uniref:Uncharacterized protein n=1 Tax=Fusobacterium nucleatum subsp. polymorphum TaxID=76857 RepID=A0A2C6AQW1_FUSNP|nr:hypothetical protein [Fusobacterium polymorphum]PHH96615.1 hypothetical protein CA840_04275 [Fusobacterium polymorphum]
MKKFVEQYDIRMSPDRIRMATQFRKEHLREFYRYKVIAIERYLIARLEEEKYNNDFDKASKIDKILSSIIGIADSTDFIKIEESIAYDNEREFQRVVFEINTTNIELARFGIDLENDTFNIIKAIENQINS